MNTADAPDAMRRTARGFTYLGVMFLVALLGLTAALAGSAWSFVAQRDKERELLFVGREYRLALMRYQQAHAVLVQPFPTSLEQLLRDRDQVSVRRYIRRLYTDPMTGDADWGLLRSAQGGIVGVYSRSQRAPIRQEGIYADEKIDFANAKSYQDWQFAAAKPAPKPAAGPAPAPAIPGAWGDSEDQGAPPPPAPPAPTKGED